jgi:ATP-dependent exoDNAse (exonuclease V) alpha subunit
VAIFYLQINSVGRGAGRRATAAAAYRAGERIRDERSGELHNYSRRRDVMHTEIFLPGQLASGAAAWARNRERLWNTAEHAEKRHNARVAREYQVALPPELSPSQRVALARTFSREVAERYKVAVDLAVHDPRPEGDSRNFHAHLLTTTREVTPAGLGAKAGLDMSGRERRRHDLPDHRQEYLTLRERWATLTNEALREANVEARIDHRSLAAQGVDREPVPAIPLMHLKMEQRGVRSELAERLRSEYRERVQRRVEHSAESAQTQGSAALTAADSANAARSQQGAKPVTQLNDLEEIRRQAREAWLRLRPKEAERAAQLRDRGHSGERAGRQSEERESTPPAEEELGL